MNGDGQTRCFAAAWRKINFLVHALQDGFCGWGISVAGSRMAKVFSGYLAPVP